MSDGEPTTVARRWSGYVCPSCRLVFKVPRDHDGRGVACPACRRLLRLPGAGDEIPPLVAAAGGTDRPAAEASADGSSGVTRRRHSRHRHRASGGEGEPAWEQAARGSRRREGAQTRLLLWVGAGVVCGLGALFWVLRLTLGQAGTAAAPMAERDAPLQLDPGLVAGLGAGREGAEESLTEGERQDEFVEAAARNEPRQVLKETEAVARRFVAASSVEEMLPLVRHPERAGPRMREWHAGHGFGLWRIRGFGEGSGATGRGQAVSVVVTLGDFSTREMGFERTPDGYRVDWESWVGWSEMSWQAFRERRPVEAKEFRVLVKPGNYYNYGFSEAAGDQCYQLDSPDRGEFLYGYVKRGSPDDDRLATADKQTPLAWTLALRYPPDAPAADQVIISGIVAKGWIVDEPSTAGGAGK